jgi:hypothetical protein
MRTNVKYVCTIHVKVHCAATAGIDQQLYLKENITKANMMAFSFCLRYYGPIIFFRERVR